MTKEKAKALEILQKELNNINNTKEADVCGVISLPHIAEKAMDDQFRRDCVLVGMVFGDCIVHNNGTLEWAGERRKK